MKRFCDFVFKYRYIFSAIVFILCVIFGINGSSIGMFCNTFSSGEENVLFGTSRQIRSDEWATMTPMLWSQYFGSHPFSYFSNIVRGTSTDVFLEYGQPVASFLMIFKPFFLGYLFLPIANGMAFFWCGRLIALFLCSFEFGRVITNDKRALSFAYASLIAFSPVVQWWFAINGLVEMIFYIELSVLLLKLYLENNKLYIRILSFLGIAICAGGYIFTMYPAWQIPFAYVLVALIIWVFSTYYKKETLARKDIAIVTVGSLLLIASVCYALLKSQTTIESILNTVYPGKRINNGGGELSRIFVYVANLWSGFKGSSPVSNVCEDARFFDLFPLCLILPIIFFIKKKSTDKLLLPVLVVDVFLSIYSFIGFPEVLSRISFLSLSTSYRAVVAIGFCNILLLFRSFSILFTPDCFKRTWVKVLAVLSILGIIITFSYVSSNGFYSKKMLLITGFVLCVLIFLVFFSKKPEMTFFSICISSVIILTGLLINPIRAGISDVESIPELCMIREIVNKSPDSLWAVVGTPYPITNFPLLAGAPTVNSTNVYPTIDRWKTVDPSGLYENTYNRYAHIEIDVTTDDDCSEKFILTSDDAFTVYLTPSELKQLGVAYIFTCGEMNEDFFDKIDETNNSYVYNIK